MTCDNAMIKKGVKTSLSTTRAKMIQNGQNIQKYKLATMIQILDKRGLLCKKTCGQIINPHLN